VEAIKPGPPLDKFAKALLAKLWVQTLQEIGEERFDDALGKALNASSFRPDIAEIRRFAGLLPVYPVEAEAREQLIAVIAAMRIHGPLLKPVPKLEGDDKAWIDSYYLYTSGEYELISPPVFSDLVYATLADIGCADLEAGLRAVWGHPALDPVRTNHYGLDKYRDLARQKIENRWIETYALLKAEGIPSKPECEKASTNARSEA
jgi:hypothetical protein